MEKFSYVLVFILLIIWVSLTFFPITPGKKKRKHDLNIEKSKRIIKRLHSFETKSIHPRAINYLRKINPYVFEELLLSALESKGFVIERSKRYSGDGGIDGRATLNGELYYIQAKRYKGYVCAKHLEDFNRTVGEKGRGLFIHTGKTGTETYNKYRHSNVTIISGSRLINLIISDIRHEK